METEVVPKSFETAWRRYLDVEKEKAEKKSAMLIKLLLLATTPIRVRILLHAFMAMDMDSQHRLTVFEHVCEFNHVAVVMGYFAHKYSIEIFINPEEIIKNLN